MQSSRPFQALARAAETGESVVLGIISGVKGSSPQKLGAKALFYADGRIAGTLGGGCLEAEIQQRALQALKVVGLGDRADHTPNQLSGGQQQRVAIARGLANNPSLLLADEPTGNLDSRTSVEIMGVFQKLNDQGITIVMVTHEMDVARYTRRMVVMRDGKVVSDTPVINRSNAETELGRLQEEDKAAQLTN